MIGAPTTALGAMADVGALAREISDVTRREPRLLRRSVREIERALREGRATVRLDEGRLVAGFLLWHPYAAWGEVGTGFVSPAHRGRGLFAQMHDDLLREMTRRGVLPFGFPGDAAVEHVMRKVGFRRAPYRTLPPGVWARFFADHYTPSKIASNLGAVRDGAHRTSLRLYVHESSPRYRSAAASRE